MLSSVYKKLKSLTMGAVSPATKSLFYSIALAAVVVAICICLYRYTSPRTIRHEIRTAVTEKSKTMQSTAVSSTDKEVSVVEKQTTGRLIDLSRSTKDVTTKIKKKTTIHDPATGVVIKVLEEEKEITALDKKEVNRDFTTVKNEQETKQIDSSKDVKDVLDSSTENTEVTTDIRVENERNQSKVGVGLNQNVNVMVTYDVIKIRKYSAAATAEVDLSKGKVSALGGAILADMDKDGTKFVGVYCQRKLKERETEVGIVAGIRF